MADFNLGNVTGLLKGEAAPAKKYVVWAKILNPAFPDIVDLMTWDELAGVWKPIQDSQTNYFLKAAISKVITAPPGGPAEGARYLIPAGATGAWAGKSDKVATWHLAAWQYTTPLDGYIIPIRTDANKLQEYRGVYGAGGAWFEYDFTVPVPPGTYIPIADKAQPLGVATLDADTKIPAEQIQGSTLPFVPDNAPDWTVGIDTIWEALEYLRYIGGGGGGPAATGTLVKSTGLYNAILTDDYPADGDGRGLLGRIMEGNVFFVGTASTPDGGGNSKFTKGMMLVALVDDPSGTDIEPIDDETKENNWWRNSAGQIGPDA